MIDSTNAPYDETLNFLVERIQQYMHLPDPAPFILVLATVAAHKMQGPPVWLMLVGPPSSGKTEALSTIANIPKVYYASTLTEAALLSGTARKDCSKNATGGLLRTIGNAGVLVAKDFTSVISMQREQRSMVLAALREIYDGKWDRLLGADGGKSLSWTGRLAFIGGVTEAIYSHHAVISSLGDRFIYFRMDELPGMFVAEKVLGRNGVAEEAKFDLQQLISYFIEAIDIPNQPDPLTEEHKHWLSNVANFVAKGRSSVERDSYRRDIIQVHTPESPGRLAGAFGQLFSSLRIIGCTPDETQRILRRVSFDCIPPERARIIKLLANNQRGNIAEDMRQGESVIYPITAIRRALEDMECLKLVERCSIDKKEAWKFTSSFLQLWRKVS